MDQKKPRAPLADEIITDAATHRLRATPRSKPERTKKKNATQLKRRLIAANASAEPSGQPMNNKMKKKLAKGEDVDMDTDVASRNVDDNDGLGQVGDELAESGEVIDPKTSVKILHGMKELNEEELNMDGALEADLDGEDFELKKKNTLTKSWFLTDHDVFLVFYMDEEIEIDGEGFADLDLDEEGMEDEAIKQFLPKEKDFVGNSLNDMILQAIAEKTAKNNAPAEQTMDPRVVTVYVDIGKWLKRYKTGSLPKPLLAIPALINWEEILCLTNPQDWTPNAMAAVTKVFASNFNERMAQRFYNLVLLPAVRDNIAEYKKLNFHYYAALKKALFKPAAFMKDEAQVMCSILGRVSVPVLRASAALIQMSMMSPWYGTVSMIMSVLINKKYSLPYSVLACLTDFFYAFTQDDREMPLVWHRSLLVFVQRYKASLSEEQRAKLLRVLKVHSHDGIGPECKRELMSAVQRQVGSNGGSDDVEMED